MKIFLSLLMLSFPIASSAQDDLLFDGDFRPLTGSIKVKGKAEIIRTAEGMDFVKIRNFSLKGGVVLDLKVCGNPAPGEYACISIGEPRRSEQTWLINVPFQKYEKVFIFDLDLIQDLALAQ